MIKKLFLKLLYKGLVFAMRRKWINESNMADFIMIPGDAKYRWSDFKSTTHLIIKKKP
jgi:hypothetical protein